MFSYIVLSVFEFTILRTNFFFKSFTSEAFYNQISEIISIISKTNFSQLTIDVIARLILFMYCLPLVMMIIFVAIKRIRNYSRKLREFHRFRIKQQLDSVNVHSTAEAIAQSYGVDLPFIVITPDKLPIAGAKFIGFPYFRHYILLSKGCLKMKKEEFEGLLAHELYHAKQHSYKWCVLDLLSDYTLFGTGFLSITINSYAQELEADYQAACWVKKNGSVPDFINALRIVSWTRSGSDGQRLNATPGSSDSAKQDVWKESAFRGLKRNLKTLFELYFGDEILSYIHPPFEERIERIKAIAKG
jgi:Zn-dependent protease with chaperone function